MHKLELKTRLGRKEIQDYLGRFKALTAATKEQARIQGIPADTLPHGVGVDCFVEGLRESTSNSETIARQLFELVNVSLTGYLSWPEYFQAMRLARLPRARQQLEFFFKGS
jgi:hypothetical protein